MVNKGPAPGITHRNPTPSLSNKLLLQNQTSKHLSIKAKFQRLNLAIQSEWLRVKVWARVKKTRDPLSACQLISTQTEECPPLLSLSILCIIPQKSLAIYHTPFEPAFVLSEKNIHVHSPRRLSSIKAAIWNFLGDPSKFT